MGASLFPGLQTKGASAPPGAPFQYTKTEVEVDWQGQCLGIFSTL